MINETLTIGATTCFRSIYFYIGIILAILWASYFVFGGLIRWTLLWMDDNTEEEWNVWPLKKAKSDDRMFILVPVTLLGVTTVFLAWPVMLVAAPFVALAYAGRAIKRGSKAFKQHVEDPGAHTRLNNDTQ